jgi:hypothetical protein
VAWSNTAKINAPSRTSDLVQQGAVDVLANPGADNAYVMSPGNSYDGTCFNLAQANRTDLLTYLSDPDYRNFYFFGHSNPTGFGDSGQWSTNPVWIDEKALRSAMANQLGVIPRAPNHPYRFVFIDGCNSANGTLCEAFGIHRANWSNGIYQNTLGLRSRAFLGYSANVPLPGTSSEYIDNRLMLAEFFGNWMNDVNLNGCVATAQNHPLWPMPTNTVIWGAYNLHRSAP